MTSQDAPSSETAADADTVEIGAQTESFESNISLLYNQYRNSSSRSDQNRVKRELQLTLESGPAESAKSIKTLLSRLFTKNEVAWRNKEQTAGPAPTSQVEFNVRKFQIAAGQPLTKDNLFNVGRMQRTKNLASLVAPGQQVLGDAKKDIRRDLDLLSSAKVGNPRRNIEHDLNLLGNAQKPKPLNSVRTSVDRLV